MDERKRPSKDIGHLVVLITNMWFGRWWLFMCFGGCVMSVERSLGTLHSTTTLSCTGWMLTDEGRDTNVLGSRLVPSIANPLTRVQLGRSQGQPNC